MKYKSITYPAEFSKNLGIGVTAPSSGLGNETFINRFEMVSEQLTQKGYLITEGICLRENSKHVSGSPLDRARDFLTLWENPNIGAIIPPWGGEVLIEILDGIDFEALVAGQAKWVLGYSDISTLLFAITVRTGIATAHGINFMDMIDAQTDSLSRQALEILQLEQGDSFSQHSSEKYQKEFVSFSDNIAATYNLAETTEWKSLTNDTPIKFSGRIIGGCLDVLVHLVGTPYGKIDHFKETFHNDGVIIYLENCELSPCAMTRALHQMRLANWFDGINGIIIGRTQATAVEEPNSLSHFEALSNCLKDLKVPVVYDADIGHMPPNMTLINGSFAELSLNEGKAILTQHLI